MSDHQNVQGDHPLPQNVTPITRLPQVACATQGSAIQPETRQVLNEPEANPKISGVHQLASIIPSAIAQDGIRCPRCRKYRRTERLFANTYGLLCEICLIDEDELDD